MRRFDSIPKVYPPYPRHFVADARLRLGLTRAEVLALLVLVLTAAGVLIVFIYQSIARSDDILCREHLKAIGDGVFKYHESKRFLPPSCIAERYATWAVLLAPYLSLPDEHPLLTWDATREFYDQPEPVRKAVVSTYFCPARSRSSPYSVSEQGGKLGNLVGAVGDYAGCAGSAGDDWDDASTPEDGAFIPAEVGERTDDRLLEWKSRLALREEDFPRSYSATILIGEKHVPKGEFGDYAVGDGSIYNGEHAWNFVRAAGSKAPLAADINAKFRYNFGSYHAGVCHFLFADGAVKALRTNISIELLARMARRASLED